MSTVESFEDLEIWQKSREICQLVFDIHEPTNLGKDYKLYNQINGSSGSIMDNITEGFERGGNEEFGEFLSVSKASRGEARSRFYRILDRKYISQKEFDDTYDTLMTLSKQISSLTNNLQKSDLKGSRFRSKP
ncbi:MAG: four helix bundle protein [Salinimicrobium sp.]